MKAYDFLEAQQNLSVLLNTAVNEDVIINDLDGIKFKIVYLKDNSIPASPLDFDGITTDITTQELVGIVREQRELW